MILLATIWQAAFDLQAVMDHYREQTRATIACGRSGPDDISDNIVICGRRLADRYRVPLNSVNTDDPRNQGVPAERARLIERPNNCQEMSTFLVGCGKVGVGVSSARGVVLGGERPIAP